MPVFDPLSSSPSEALPEHRPTPRLQHPLGPFSSAGGPRARSYHVFEGEIELEDSRFPDVQGGARAAIVRDNAISQQ